MGNPEPVREVWLRTRVDHAYAQVKLNRTTGEATTDPVPGDPEVFNSFKITDPGQPIHIAVQDHLRQLRGSAKRYATADFLNFTTQICGTVQTIKTDTKKVNGHTFEQEYQEDPKERCESKPLWSAAVVPDETTLANLLRGAEMTVALFDARKKEEGKRLAAEPKPQDGYSAMPVPADPGKVKKGEPRMPVPPVWPHLGRVSEE